MENNSNPICPLCLDNKVTFIGKPQISQQAKEFIHKDYRVVKCKECNYYFVHPKISFSPQQWTILYGDEYFVEMTNWWAKKRGQHRKKRLDMLQQYKKDGIKKFLDVGCGEGYVLMDALKRKWEVYGIDIYDNRIEDAKDKSINFFKGEISHASFPDEFFDCIYADSVLEHLLEPNLFLNEIKRILKVGGIIYVAVPNENSIFNDIRKIIFTILGKPKLSSRINPFKGPFHVIGFTKNSLIRILNQNNFEVIRLRSFGGHYEWRKFKMFTRGFLIHFCMLPFQLIAIPFKKRKTLDVFVRKKGL